MSTKYWVWLWYFALPQNPEMEIYGTIFFLFIWRSHTSTQNPVTMKIAHPRHRKQSRVTLRPMFFFPRRLANFGLGCGHTYHCYSTQTANNRKWSECLFSISARITRRQNRETRASPFIRICCCAVLYWICHDVFHIFHHPHWVL